MSKATPTYSDLQAKLIANLKDNHTYNKATNVVVYDVEKLEMPEGISQESVQNHVNYFNQMSGAVEVATAELARDFYKENDKLNILEGTVGFGGVMFNTEHTLMSEVGDDKLYGASTTMTDFTHSQEASDWLAEQRETNESLARKLFS